MGKSRKSKLGMVLMAIVIGYFLFIIADQEKVINVKQVEMKQLQNKIEEQKSLSKDLLKQQKDVNSDQFIEKIAREKLGMVKPGEKIFNDINK